MTDVRHDGGTAGRGRDSWVDPGQDLDALLSGWSEQPGPFRARGRHSAPEAAPPAAGPPPPSYLPPSGRRFRDDDAPAPEWARHAGERSRRRSVPEPPATPPAAPRREMTHSEDRSAPPPTSRSRAVDPGPARDDGLRVGSPRDGGPRSAGASRDGGPRAAGASRDGGPRAGRRADGDEVGDPFRSGPGLSGRGSWDDGAGRRWDSAGRSGAEVAGAAFSGRRARDDRTPRDDAPAPRGHRDEALSPRGHRDEASGPRGYRDEAPGPLGHRDDAPGPRAYRDDAPGPRGYRDEAPGPRRYRDEAPGPRAYRTDSGPELRGFRDDHPSGPNLGFGPMRGGILPPPSAPAPDLHQALLAQPAPPPTFDDTGAYAGWLSRGGTTAAVLDRPTAGGQDLLTHSPAYDPYAPEIDTEADDDLPPNRPPHRRRARSRRPRWLRILGWVGAFVGILLVAGGGFAAYQYKKLSGNINREDVLATDDKAIRDAAKQLDAENYLLLGSDTREGENAKYGVVSGERSDTTILAHLSPNRDKATMISFPRDAWVDLPACRKPDGTMSPEQPGQFNSAFTIGGAQCTVLTVQKMTGIRINHYVKVNFAGFKNMVDAVGGVPICTTTRLRDDESGLRLNPGTTNLQGEQALAYVRARYGLGDGSDLGRIQRQQKFLAAMVRKATSTKLLLNPIGLTKFLDAATKSLTLDTKTSLGDLKKLADQLRDLDPKKVSFLTAPIADAAYTPPGFPAPPPGKGGSRVLLDDVAGRKLYDSIINDKPAPPKGAPKTTGAPKPTVLTVAPEDVTVKVRNGVGLDGLGRKVAGELESAGFQMGGQPDNAPKVTRTTVRYAPSQAAQARTVAAAVPGAVLQPSNDVGTAVELVVGPDYTSVVTVQVGDPASAKTVAAPKPSASTSAPKPSPTVNAADASCT